MASKLEIIDTVSIAVLTVVTFILFYYVYQSTMSNATNITTIMGQWSHKTIGTYLQYWASFDPSSNCGSSTAHCSPCTGSNCKSMWGTFAVGPKIEIFQAGSNLLVYIPAFKFPAMPGSSPLMITFETPLPSTLQSLYVPFWYVGTGPGGQWVEGNASLTNTGIYCLNNLGPGVGFFPAASSGTPTSFTTYAFSYSTIV
jgi:hypothetical protein